MLHLSQWQPTNPPQQRGQKVNNKEIATAIVKALENKDSETLYGIALELLKDETTTEKAGN